MRTRDDAKNYTLPVKIILADIFFDKEKSELFFGFFKSSLDKLYFPNRKLEKNTDSNSLVFSMINDCVILESVENIIMNVEYASDLPDRYIGHSDRDISILYSAVLPIDSKINDRLELVDFKDFTQMNLNNPEKFQDDHGQLAQIICGGNPNTAVPEDSKDGAFLNVNG
tara:strand:- start:696 stop:1202 length:507 start_codon:yes stop_codon:yes gene_type:complete